MRFLVVEDHLRMADQLAEGFAERGYVAKVVNNGEDGLFEAQEIDYTLAVIDLGLPGMSGLDLIKRLRKAGNTLPIIVLTARDDVESIVQAMEAGADDYLKKPVYFAELFAHIEAVLRRVLGDPKLDQPLLEFANLQLDTRARLVHRGEERIEFTRAEYEIVEHLWRNAGRVQSKKSIADSYQRDPGADTRANSVEGLVGRVKRKLDPDGSLKPIETVRGRGYLFRDSD
ncbi:response regulator transcription factor [Halieaceae bacterium IMCC14734]|uniref:Response regulator transcription factor n=1 Tax=Candidatus Litorirhabdus singularis TaxID=2518993 RepID=A0ABT3TKJ0_9GAMM|nr:response regulator transcription factor [Candidatus Litorirhabdus singularis]MCX2982291.1 response regulator transcription factor [Candidatus Litorirhabdus singularis]